MAFSPVWTEEAAGQFASLRAAAEESNSNRKRDRKTKASKAGGLFKQVEKCIGYLLANPKHPGPSTHEFHSIEHPYEKGHKVFEAYAQNRTPGAYRVFWCYGVRKGQITIIAITPHP